MMSLAILRSSRSWVQWWMGGGQVGEVHLLAEHQAQQHRAVAQAQFQVLLDRRLQPPVPHRRVRGLSVEVPLPLLGDARHPLVRRIDDLPRPQIVEDHSHLGLRGSAVEDPGELRADDVDAGDVRVQVVGEVVVDPEEGQDVVGELQLLELGHRVRPARERGVPLGPGCVDPEPGEPFDGVRQGFGGVLVRLPGARGLVQLEDPLAGRRVLAYLLARAGHHGSLSLSFGHACVVVRGGVPVAVTARDAGGRSTQSTTMRPRSGDLRHASAWGGAKSGGRPASSVGRPGDHWSDY
jgi:hypothetical protein